MKTPTLGLALIARDEEETLPNLLASIEGAFDQVALLDTGSEDATVEVFETWAAAERERNPAFVHTVGHFEWIDDFAAARNAADDLLDTDWLCWADCDDVIVGADRLRLAITNVPREGLQGSTVVGLKFTYAFTDADGSPNVDAGLAWRRRVNRRGFGLWRGRLHEDVDVPAHQVDVPLDRLEVIEIPPYVCHWQHQRQGFRDSSLERNDRVLQRWVEDEPLNLRPLGMLASREIEKGNYDQGLDHFTRYLELSFPPPPPRFQHNASGNLLSSRPPADQAEATAAETAQWALGVLEDLCEEAEGGGLSSTEFTVVAVPLMAILLGREPSFWTSATVSCAEDRRNPEPAHLPELQATVEAPKTRQQRRAEARKRAKELAA